MDVILFAAVLVALAAYVAAPLYRVSAPQRVAGNGYDQTTDSLATTLSELEIDRATGLLDEAEYRRERAELELEDEKGSD